MAMRLSATLALIAVALPAFAGAQAAAAELVVVHPSCPDDTITDDTLKALYSGRKRSLPSGERVEILVLSGGPVHERFLADHLGRTPDDFENAWRRMVFTGQGHEPRGFANEADLVAYVAGHPGSIGYIDADTPHAQVKVLKVGE
jgi:hypothetical protein